MAGVKAAGWGAWTMIVVGALGGLIGLLDLSVRGGFSVALVVGVVSCAAGVGLLLNDLYRLTDSELQLRNAYGITLRRYPRSSLRVERQGERRALVAVLPDGKTRTMFTDNSWALNRSQINAVLEAVERG